MLANVHYWPLMRLLSWANFADMSQPTNPTPLQENIGLVITRLRKQRGWSQLSLAEKARVDRRYMSDVENGKRNLSLDVLQRLATALGIRTSTLILNAELLTEPALTVDNLRQWLVEHDCQETVILESPDYITAIVGISDDSRLVYSYNLMVEYLMVADGMPCDEAAEFIDYNTVRALPYMGVHAPVISYEITD